MYLKTSVGMLESWFIVKRETGNACLFDPLILKR